MTLILNGTVGVSDVDGSAATPAIRGTDANTGMFFPAADTIAFAEGGVEAMRINSDGQLVSGAGSVSLPSITTTGDTNTGIFFPAADTIAFSEGGVEAMRLDSSGNLQFNSGYGSVATAYGPRAWVNFNGTGTIAIRGSGNVSSITDGGTGLYTVNLSTAMPDANYSVAMVIKNTSNSFGYALEADVSAGSFNLGLRNTVNGALFDSTTVCAMVIR
jgi:hypothetical protein